MLGKGIGWRIPEWGWLLTLTFYCFEKWAPTKLPKDWPVIPWGWLTLIGLALWAGFQLQKWRDGTNRLQQCIQDWRELVGFSGIRIEKNESIGLASVELFFRKGLRNATATVDVYSLRNGNREIAWYERSGGWVRIRRLTAFAHKNWNSGDRHYVPLFAVRLTTDTAQTSPVVVYKEGFYRSIVTITCDGGGPTSRRQDFFFADGDEPAIIQLPIGAPEVPLLGDGQDYQEARHAQDAR